MSWLSGEINKVLSKQPYDALALRNMMEVIEKEYDARRNEVRVHDVRGEGILYGERKNTVCSGDSCSFQLTCSQEMFNQGGEEAYSRGLFNQKELAIDDDPLRFISYEAPLLRKKEGRGGGICKLDLVAINANAIWAIEYKQSYGQVTSARYALLESLAYGFLLALHIRDNKEDIVKQIDKCISSRGPFSDACGDLSSGVKFAVAAPVNFYIQDTRTDRRMGLTKEITELSCLFADDVSKRIGVELSFGGFLIIGDDNTVLEARPTDNNDVVPYFSPEITSIPTFVDINKVREHVIE